MTSAAVDGIPTSLKFNKDIKTLPSLPRLHIEYCIQDNGPRWFSSVRALTPLLAAGFWKWLRPEFKRGQISCPFQGSGRSRIMRFIGVLRNAAKTGDEYPNGDRVRGERTGKRKGGWATMELIDEKEKFDPRAIFVRACTPRAPIARYLRRMHSVQPSYQRLLSYFSRIFVVSTLLAKYKPLT